MHKAVGVMSPFAQDEFVTDSVMPVVSIEPLPVITTFAPFWTILTV